MGSVVKKFVIWIAVIVVLVGALTAVFVQMNLTKTLSKEFRERGQVVSRNLASSSVEPLLIDDTVNLHRLVENVKNMEKDIKYAYIIDVKGRVLAHTFEGGFPSDLLSIRNDANGRLLYTGDGYVIDITAPILDGRAGFVHVGMDETYLNEKIAKTRDFIIALTLIVGAMGVLMAYIAGSHLTRPIRALAKGAEEIGRGNFDYQIDTVSSDETHILSEAFNQMSHNLNNSISELRASRERYRKLLDSISDAVMLIDSEKRILSWNSAAQKIFGYSLEEVAGRRIDMLYHSSTDTVNAKDLEIRDGEKVLIKKDGSTFPGFVKIKPLQDSANTGNVVVIKDITDQKEMAKLEKQLLQAEKLATVGKLAAGVAHEINNPLTSISLHTQIMLKKKVDESTNDRLKIINREAHRAARIVKELLEFARQSEPKLNSVNINNEIEKVLKILDPQLNGIRVTTVLEPLPPIMADSEQIQQVIINMMTNSIQSIITNGEIIIRTTAEKDNIKISITDNGCGIPQENIGKIFDPFFTTKKLGEGTGLGLSTCYGIIKQHNGSIDVKSEVGTGTTFIIRLPI